MRLHHLTLLGALAWAVTVASPAYAISVNVTDFSFTSAPGVSTNNSADGTRYAGQAGRFDGSYDASTPLPSGIGLLATTGPGTTSFVGYCAELTQSFTFDTLYTDYTLATGTAEFGARKSADLSRLFTAYGSFVVDAASSAAMQAAIWEILYEQGTGYDLESGNFTVGTSDAATARAFARVDALLGSLSSYGTNFQISVLDSPSAQNFLIATSVPEPGTWALYAGGLAAIGLMIRRRRAD